MATKTYQSKLTFLSALIWVAGKYTRISFSGSVDGGGGLFTTADADTQKAIEKSEKFASKEIYVYRTYGDDAKPAEKVEEKPEEKKELEKGAGSTEPKVYPLEIKTVQMAGRELVKDYGIKKGEVETKAKLLDKAKELNVSFPGIIE